MSRVLLVLATVLGLLGVVVDGAGAQDEDEGAEPLCSLDEAAETPEADDDASLAGRLGGSRDSFEDRFGEPVSEELFAEYEVGGCGTVFATFEEDVLTSVSIYSPGYDDDEAEWSIEEAGRIAERVLPRDVEMADPYRNVSFVEHHECFSETLAEEVPESVYAYVDNNPTQGQCSVVFSLDDNDEVLSFVVQLQIEDPN